MALNNTICGIAAFISAIMHLIKAKNLKIKDTDNNNLFFIIKFIGNAEFLDFINVNINVKVNLWLDFFSKTDHIYTISSFLSQI